MKQALKAGTRGSRLALWQTDYITATLQGAFPDLVCERTIFTTRGDRILNTPLPQIGGKGLFTAELEHALRAGVIDIAVHSLKDLPTKNAPGLIIGAVPVRAPVHDVLVASRRCTLSSLPGGALLGSSSHRRAAQARALRPDLDIRPIRGNVETRIGKVLDGQYEGTLMAAAGLYRLGLTDHIVEELSFDVMLPAPGQGALGVQCREDDDDTLALLGTIESPNTRGATTAERSFLAALGGGCSTPIAAYSTVTETGHYQMTTLVASTDGEIVIRAEGINADPEALGKALAEEALAQGAAEVLAHV